MQTMDYPASVVVDAIGRLNNQFQNGCSTGGFLQTHIPSLSPFSADDALSKISSIFMRHADASSYNLESHHFACVLYPLIPMFWFVFHKSIPE